jgi:hypothetical protein
VEESALLRWWHSYDCNGIVWKRRTSSEFVLSKVAVLYAEGVLGVGEKAMNESVYYYQVVGKTQRAERSGVHGSGRESLDVIDVT